ncbi:PD-(D/E)XK nuclease family protein [Methanosphaerula palustris]|uniref:PD-(D/E)XK nuclease family protein n=1 Tax=Methanosphaerula palustris TaxID=475088 RepID=UPI000326106F|nr:PD-(D/E)XK nuclease family protein [Methanosphaerula palustris]
MFVVTLASGKRVAGTIDRLCELADGLWAVIDYKSDPVTPAVYASKAEEDGLSLLVYCEAAGQLVGLEVAGWLYFTEMGDFER